ncbi:unnamed protein product [Prunus armeniaca]|uniref:Uncharacterized protein n=1 Tax=Prunus armeniaca TaxID=36596 RepID=A0A6J5UJ80_PRUAR|nr:unnamed protein product [Prunus armeniaca]CAB4306537.1 unnamed protein product [Prunus armeniaca]
MAAPALQETYEQPLLENNAASIEPKPPKTPAQKAIRKTFKGTAHLSNLLPTGTVLVFQMFSPGFTRQGQCPTPINKTMTLGLLIVCSLTCFLLCFTDSLRDERGKVRYGLATFKGLWVIDGSKVAIAPEEVAKYRLRFIDIFHALMSIFVFAALALVDQNVVNCFYPKPSEEGKQLLAAFPVGIAVVCSLLFVLFPTKRHGIGFPLSRS